MPIPMRMVAAATANDWYWFIGGDTTKVWSSKLGSYVDVSDQTYVAWTARNVTAFSASEYELSKALDVYGVVGPVVLPEKVDAECDRRSQAGFMFNGHMFQFRLKDQKRINGAVTMAIMALQAGVSPDNLRWHGGESDFAWLAADNALIPMDARTVCSFGASAGEWEAKHVFAARALKDMKPIPRDFTNDSYWPS